MKSKQIQKLDRKKLSEVCEIFSGGTPSTKNKEYWNGTILWLSSGETRNNFILGTEKKITLSGVKNSSTRLAKKGDVIVASAGQGHTRGQVSLCLIDTYVNQSLIVLRTNNEIILPKFLFYNLKSRYQELRRISDSHSSRGSLPKNVLSDVEISFPPLLEQEKITKSLYDLDIKIENLQTQNKVLEAIVKAIFKSWFVDFDGVTEFEDSEFGEIPKGWTIEKIQDLCTLIQNGGTPKRMETTFWENGIINWFKTGELNDDFLLESEEKITELGLQKSSCHLWPKGTILFAIYAYPVVGRMGILTKPSCSNQASTGLIPKNEVGTYFLFLSLIFSRNSLGIIATGAAQQNISQDIVQNHKIILPPFSLISKFNKKFGPIFEKIKINQMELLLLRNICDTILPKLMSGEIRV